MIFGKVKPKIVGLSNFHYAVMLTDEETNISYRTPKPLHGARGVSVTPITAGDQYYEDDMMTEDFEEVTGATVEITVSSLLPQEYADIMGQVIHEKMIVDNLLAQRPYVAFGYRRLLSQANADGSPAYRYIWLYKGKFNIPDESGTTKEGQKAPQEPVIRATFMPLAGMLTNSQGTAGQFWRAQGGDEFTGWTPEDSETWFDTVKGIVPEPTIVPDPAPAP